jgi:hypothetical protein
MVSKSQAKGDKAMKIQMKRSLRALLLLVGLVGTFAYASVPKFQDGPMPLCPPSRPNCPDDEFRLR